MISHRDTGRVRIGGVGLPLPDVLALMDAVARETMVFAAVGFLIGGIDDLAVDAIYLIRFAWRRLWGVRDPTLADLPPTQRRFAVFVPAWREAEVIGPMLRTMLARFTQAGVRVYVGLYPNDRPTIDAVLNVAANDPRVVPVIGRADGPTTKADNLNALWRALQRDEAATGVKPHAIVLHDAEDVVHPAELTVFGAWLDRYDAVQLPVAPLPDARSRFVGGTYLDEFAEAHGKAMVVRQAIGAGLPFAGTGCAIDRAMLGRVADARGGLPFDAASLTEDYELGLTIAGMGGRVALAWVTEADRRTPVAVRSYFPARLDTAVPQKARWMVGIALAGWDRTGWARPTAIAEHWMRARDRRAPIAVIVLVAAYAALVLWGVQLGLHLAIERVPPSVAEWMQLVLIANAVMLGWRLAMRAAFVWRAEGWREGLRSAPRMAVGNLVAMLAARRAVVRYIAMLRGAPTWWDKTAHHFPIGLIR